MTIGLDLDLDLRLCLVTLLTYHKTYITVSSLSVVLRRDLEALLSQSNLPTSVNVLNLRSSSFALAYHFILFFIISLVTSSGLR